MDQLPRLGKRELICLLLFTCNYLVSVRRGFLFVLVLGIGYVCLLLNSLSLPYKYFEYCTSNRFIIFITSNRRTFIFKITKYRRFNCTVSKYARCVDEIDTLIDEWNFDKVPNLIHFRFNVWSKSVLSVTSSTKSCLIEAMFSIIEFISFWVHTNLSHTPENYF